jgi:hypothetical protein
MSDTHKCSNCGDGDEDRKENFLDGCSKENLGCENPCGRGPHNSAKCESLPSQISNFTTQFFGEVVKTEVDGKVVWSLPCSLDVGLPANPRGTDEGLACYFLRLFMDGIVGLKGDKGDKGNPGTNGNNAYTVTLSSFTQPSLSAPTVAVFTANNPAVNLIGTYLFIDTSGWYVVNDSDGAGTLFLTLIQALSSAPATISAGKLVIESGIPGVQGQKGDSIKGDKGDKGDPGSSFTTENGVYTATAGTNFPLPNPFATVDFGTSIPQFLAVDAGKYLVMVTAMILADAALINIADFCSLKLVNDNTAADVVGSQQTISGWETTTAGQYRQITLISIVETLNPNQTITLYGECSTAAHASIMWQGTTFTHIRIA